MKGRRTLTFVVVARGIARSVARGLAQAGSLGMGVPHTPFPAPQSGASALRGDWERLGRDMHRAIKAERRRGKTDAT